MKGTSFSHQLAIDLMPPSMTIAVSTVMTNPVIQGEILKVSWTIDEIELAWTMFPIPKAATAVSPAKMRPSQRVFSPRSRTYMGPLAMKPALVLTRYLTDSTASDHSPAGCTSHL